MCGPIPPTQHLSCHKPANIHIHTHIYNHIHTHSGTHTYPMPRHVNPRPDMYTQKHIHGRRTYMISDAHTYTHTHTNTQTHMDMDKNACTHSLTHSLTHSIAHSLTHSLTHSLAHSPTHSLTHHPPTHSLIHPLTHSLAVLHTIKYSRLTNPLNPGRMWPCSIEYAQHANSIKPHHTRPSTYTHTHTHPHKHAPTCTHACPYTHARLHRYKHAICSPLMTLRQLALLSAMGALDGTPLCIPTRTRRPQCMHMSDAADATAGISSCSRSLLPFCCCCGGCGCSANCSQSRSRRVEIDVGVPVACRLPCVDCGVNVEATDSRGGRRKRGIPVPTATPCPTSSTTTSLEMESNDVPQDPARPVSRVWSGRMARRWPRALPSPVKLRVLALSTPVRPLADWILMPECHEMLPRGEVGQGSGEWGWWMVNGAGQRRAGQRRAVDSGMSARESPLPSR